MKPKYLVSIDRAKPLQQDPVGGHNRWHPEIPPVITVEEGEIVALETRDAFDGQINHDSTIADLLNVSLGRVHPMTGPVFIRGAEPGDILEVDIHQVKPAGHAYTVQGPKFGFLRDIFSENHLVKWTLQDGYATSEDIPGVRIPGSPFMGLMGVAPSSALLQTIRQRESELVRGGKFVMEPSPVDAIPADGTIAGEGLSSLPPREFGGNIDVKQLVAGTTLRLPVFVEGALFSAGDGHFSQGDNECCTAIEMGATLYCSFRVIKRVASQREITDPEFYLGEAMVSTMRKSLTPVESRPFHATTGFCRNSKGENHSEDLNLRRP